MKSLFAIFFLFAASVAAWAQAPVICGTVGEEARQITQRLLANKEAYRKNPVDMRSTIYVPVKFHLVAKNDGTDRVTESQVLDALCLLNQVYANLDIQFYINNGFAYLNNSVAFDRPRSVIRSVLLGRRDATSMNIFVVGAIDQQNNENGVVAGFYRSDVDFIVINKTYLTGVNNTLAHEVGHFFSLLHTHNGWDSQPWDASVGNPAPATSPDNVPTERVARTNCENSGDYICDTPADYNGLGMLSCRYTRGARDPDSTLLAPDPTNIMSYFEGCEPTTFSISEEQKAMIRTDLTSDVSCTQCVNTPGRAYIRRAFSPVALSEAPQLVSPVGGRDAPGGSGSVRLEWTAVNGAGSYIVEVDRLPTFSSSTVRLTVTTNFVDVSGLDFGRRYFWRVRPFNSLVTCRSLSTAVESFRVTDAVSSINNLDFLREWSLSPNPVSNGRELELFLESEEAFLADLVVFSATGQVIRAIGRKQFSPGENRMSLPTGDLSPGIYLLSLRAGGGYWNKRFVVLD